jgi:hypothetical protein
VASLLVVLNHDPVSNPVFDSCFILYHIDLVYIPLEYPHYYSALGRRANH